jgi:hypothetical protein
VVLFHRPAQLAPHPRAALDAGHGSKVTDVTFVGHDRRAQPVLLLPGRERPDPFATLPRSISGYRRRPSQAVGLMLYLKLSLTGDEAGLLKRHRFIHPDFPHQSTLGQFYDEEQFEACRQLGVHVAEGTFSPALMTRSLLPASVSE